MARATTSSRPCRPRPTISPSPPSGFSGYLQKGILLQADAAVTQNVSLKTGATTETVTVTSDALQVDTTTGTISQVINSSLVNELPLNGRNAAALTLLVPGVVWAPNQGADQGNQKSFPGVVTISANGTRANQTNYMLDGGNNVDEYTNVNAPFPMPDSVQEFSVQTSNYNAEYGQNAGGVVNVITKSGTNKCHGNLFEYVRNADLQRRALLRLDQANAQRDHLIKSARSFEAQPVRRHHRWPYHA